MLKLVILIVLLFISFIYTAVPCGRCLGSGDVCAKPTDHCRNDLTCTTVARGGAQTAQICYPTVHPGNWCNHTKDYNPCEEGYVCDRFGSGNCEISQAYAKVNDGCKSNSSCVAGLMCDNGLCKTIQPYCTSQSHCLWNQYCNLTFPLSDSKCNDLPAAGQACLPFVRFCKYGLICGVDTICVAPFSVAEGGKCNTIKECKTALDCIDDVCTKPTFHFLGAPGVLWGPECDPSDGTTGCTCNYGSSIFQYVKEAYLLYTNENCLNIGKDFEKCMIDNKCTSSNNGADTCMRKYCYTLYKDSQDACLFSEPTLRPPRCGATEMVVLMLFVVIMILL